MNRALLPRSVLLGLVAIAAAALLTVPVVVADEDDAPHWSSPTDTLNCTTPCHVLHNAAGGNLTSEAGNVNLCQSCHSSTGQNDFPLDSGDSANPGVTGTSHAFNAVATNAAAGALPPQNNDMLLRLMGPGADTVVCSTCHDQHAAEKITGGRPRISPAAKIADGGGTGTLTSGGTYTADIGAWYLIEIDTAGAADGAATFRYSKDRGTTWFEETVPATTTPAALGDGSGVTTAFSGTFAVGDRFEFYGSWPFLRATLDTGDNAAVEKFCRDCHRSWVMTHTDVETWDGTPKSHPVGVPLDANGRGYDRTVPLDGDGSDQGGAGDGNPSNDFRLDAGGRVHCLSCHGVHYADSNTLSVDAP
jgi:hypothetical protein